MEVLSFGNTLSAFQSIGISLVHFIGVSSIQFIDVSFYRFISVALFLIIGIALYHCIGIAQLHLIGVAALRRFGVSSYQSIRFAVIQAISISTYWLIIVSGYRHCNVSQAHFHLTRFTTMSKAHVIAFATQKGGVGKSTLTTHMASALHYLYGYKVAVVDCDYPQHTVQAYRVQEMAKLRDDQAQKDRVTAQGITPYPIVSTKLETAVAAINAFEEKGCDFILVDTTGSLNLPGLPELLQRVNFIFMPMEPDMGTLASTMAFMEVVNKRFLKSVNTNSNLVGVYAFWNKYLKSEKKDIYARVATLFGAQGIPLLNSRVETLVSIKEKRSTLFPMPQAELGKIGLGQLISEIITLIFSQQSLQTLNGLTISFTPTDWPELRPAAELSASSEAQLPETPQSTENQLEATA